MPYTTLQALIDRYGEAMLIGLTDRGDVQTGQIDGSVVDSAIAAADALIDGYLGARIKLPLTEVPPLVSQLSRKIAIYELHNGGVDPMIEADHTAAIKSLEAISAGRIRLPGVQGIEPEGTGGTGARLTDRARPMNEADLKGYI